MKESYNQQITAFALKVVVSLGSIYFISETVMGQLKHLFNFETIDDALFWFYLIYFILPLLVIVIYFLFKKDSVVVFSRIPRNNLAFAGIGALFLVAISVAYFFKVDVVSYFGFVLLGLAFLFIVYTGAIKFTKEFVGKIELLVLSLLVILFGLAYQLRNGTRANDYENATKRESIVKAYDLVDNYISQPSNVLESDNKDLEKEQIITTLNLDVARIDRKDKKLTENLIALVNEKWGRYINVIAYKGLLILIPLISFILTCIYLFRTSFNPPESKAILKQEGSNYVFSPAEEQRPPQEKEFLKTMLIVLVTLTIPLLHPLEKINTSFDRPFISYFGDAQNIVIPRIEKDKPKIKIGDSTELVINILDFDGQKVYVLAPKVTQITTVLGTNEISSLNAGLQTINENLMRFSNRFGGNRPPPSKTENGLTQNATYHYESSTDLLPLGTKKDK